MKKCYECGAIFDEGEEKEITEPHGETHFVCPYCHGGYEESEKCKCCGENFAKSELLGDLCEECIKESVTVENVKKYLEECGLFADFMIRFYYGFDVFVGQLNEVNEKEIDFKSLFEEKTTTKNLNVLCKKYINEEFEHFAEWLYLQNRKEASL